MQIDYDKDVLNDLTVKKLMASLTEEECDLLRLWMGGAFTLEEIGRILGQKYYGQDIASSVIRYRRNKIFSKLRRNFSV